MLQFLPLTLDGLSLHARERWCLCIGHQRLDGSFSETTHTLSYSPKNGKDRANKSLVHAFNTSHSL